MSAPEPADVVTVTVRRVPKFWVFMGIGIMLGVIAAIVIALTGNYEPSAATKVTYPPEQVFGFALLWTVPIGLALGGVVALVLERTARRHNRELRVSRETISVPKDDTSGDAV